MTAHAPSEPSNPPVLGFRLEDPRRIERLNALLEQVRRMRTLDDEQTRYGAAAASVEPALCCPVTYDREALSHVPARILAVDYGCGDPTVYARRGQRVLDLGSGSGKHVFMIAKAVGPTGHVVGIDKTPEMLALARGAIEEVTQRLGYAAPNMEFRCGHIEDLRIDKDRLSHWMDANDLASYDDAERLESHLSEAPLVATGSIDLVVSNCVLNLVDDGRKRDLIVELYRVLAPDGSVAISDIVADRPIPAALKGDAELWTGCLSGAWQRSELEHAFTSAGFHGVTEVACTFWKRVAGIDFFSVTVRAFKGRVGPCYETYREALYRGPFSEVSDDDGHRYRRGEFVPVCHKTAEVLSREPYRGAFLVTPALEDPESRLPFDCGGGTRAPLPREIAERRAQATDAGDCCNDAGCC